ncbi:HAMP domain-containing histidine kinase, partial [Candidatus Nomurabacteria bacterium]|nr:HAMP domain-containing histidine kinase [Candidatus Nomurabacteria bacterium]
MEEIEKLKEEIEKLKIINENKSDLISISAHQIRTSLTAFKWTLKMFSNEELGKINDEQRTYLERIINNNDYTISLVNNLLNLNHLKDLPTNLDLKPIDITGTINKVLVLFFGESKSKNININFEKPEKEIPSVNCDEEMIIIVLQNIIENALKYSKDNTEIKISLSYNEEDKNISIHVHNDGIGIKEEDHSHIFSKFFRANNAKEKDPVGSGFGLFATKNI